MVPGEPKAKGRPRFRTTGRAYTPNDTASYENLVKLAYRDEVGDVMLDGQLFCRITAYFPIPKSVTKKRRILMSAEHIRPIKRPDLDNIGKTIADALNHIAYGDDSQIVTMVISKKYSENPCVVCEIRTWDDVPTDGELVFW